MQSTIPAILFLLVKKFLNLQSGHIGVGAPTALPQRVLVNSSTSGQLIALKSGPSRDRKP